MPRVGAAGSYSVPADTRGVLALMCGLLCRQKVTQRAAPHGRRHASSAPAPLGLLLLQTVAQPEAVAGEVQHSRPADCGWRSTTAAVSLCLRHLAAASPL